MGLSLRQFTAGHSSVFAPLFAVRRSVKKIVDGAICRRRHPDVEIIPARPRSGDERYFSSIGQDRFFDEYILPKSPNGVFVDIGCNHPQKGSNSAFLEEAGWTGVAFDPQKRFEAEWAASRKTPFVCAAVARDAREEEFIAFDVNHGWEHEVSGFADYVKPSLISSLPHKRYNVLAGPLSHHRPDLSDIDLALIDVEGAEHLVLDGLESDGVKPRWIMIENNRKLGGDESIRRRLVATGYRLHARIGNTDDFFERLDQTDADRSSHDR